MKDSATDTCSRRGFLDFATTGLGGAALVGLLGREAGAAAQSPGHPPARARRAVHICLVGGLSQVDSFDHKPELSRLQGQPLPGGAQPETFFGSVGLLRGSEWGFRRRGDSGLWISELFPHLATVADELTVIRSMVADTANHMPAMFQENSGFQANGYPSLGSWLSYGLGNESDSLPTFVVLPDARSQPNGGASNWSSGFLPASHQGVLFQAAGAPIRVITDPPAIHPPDEIATRALSHVGRDGYCPVVENCEHFASWCATGQRGSRQVDLLAARVASTATRVAAVVAARAAAGAAQRVVIRTAVGTTVRFGLRTLLPATFVAEGAAMMVEWSAHQAGHSPERSRRAGESAGLAASAAICGAATAAAGPAAILTGALAGAALWLGGSAAAGVAERALRPGAPVRDAKAGQRLD